MRMRASGRSSLRLCLAVLAWGSATAALAAGVKSIDSAAAAAASALTAADDYTGKLPTGSAPAVLTDVPAPAAPPAPTGFDAPHAAAAPVVAPAPVSAVSATVVPIDQPAALPSAGSSAPAAADPTPSPSAAPPLTSAALHQAVEVFAKTATPGAAEYRLADVLLQKQHAEIAEFYALRGDAPVWVDGSQWTPVARQIIEFLSHAGDDGLDLAPYAIPVTPGTSDSERAVAELALSDAVAAYAFQASGGRVDPAKVNPLIGEKPSVAGALDVLVDVAIAADPLAVLRGYLPTQPEYVALREQLQEIRAHAGPIAKTRIPAGPVLKLGMRDPRVLLIRARFGLDSTPADTAENNLVYDSIVASAVAGFQRANGLPPSGALTSRTVAALSAGPSNVENEIVANMERWRWMPRDTNPDRVVVNVPEFTLRLYQAGVVSHTARVIVGKPTTPTPIFSNEMKYLTVNPSWYVPQSIIKKEMLPKLAEDPDYLTRHGYEVTRHGDTLSVRQPPGDGNALGHIVFWFPNQYAVYLHDTPTRGMFAAGRRAFSHGCVRLEDPFKFAEMVLGNRSGWTEDRLRRLIGSSEHYMNLPKALPISIVYFTADVDASGKLEIHDDVYGYSKRVQAALGLQG